MSKKIHFCPYVIYSSQSMFINYLNYIIPFKKEESKYEVTLLIVVQNPSHIYFPYQISILPENDSSPFGHSDVYLPTSSTITCAVRGLMILTDYHILLGYYYFSLEICYLFSNQINRNIKYIANNLIL